MCTNVHVWCDSNTNLCGQVHHYQGQFCALLYVHVAETSHSDLTKGDVLISGVTSIHCKAFRL